MTVKSEFRILKDSPEYKEFVKPDGRYVDYVFSKQMVGVSNIIRQKYPFVIKEDSEMEVVYSNELFVISSKEWDDFYNELMELAHNSEYVTRANIINVIAGLVINSISPKEKEIKPEP